MIIWLYLDVFSIRKVVRHWFFARPKYLDITYCQFMHDKKFIKNFGHLLYGERKGQLYLMGLWKKDWKGTSYVFLYESYCCISMHYCLYII